MCPAQGTKDFPGTDSLHPPQTLARETDCTPPYRLAQMVKNPHAKQKALCSNQRRFDSCVRKIPWRREWQPTPEFDQTDGGAPWPKLKRIPQAQLERSPPGYHT